MSEEKNEGWVCPVCKTVKAPSVKMCKPCSKDLKEQTKDGKQFIQD